MSQEPDPAAGPRAISSAPVELVCEVCGSIERPESTKVAELLDELRRTERFVARAAQVTAFGSCRHCPAD